MEYLGKVRLNLHQITSKLSRVQVRGRVWVNVKF